MSQSNIDLLKTLLDSGKKIYIRAEGYATNTTMLYDMFDVDTTTMPTVTDVSPNSLQARIDTIGFVLHYSEKGQLYIVRQSIEEVSLEEMSEERVVTSCLGNSKITLKQELNCIQDYVENTEPSVIKENYARTLRDAEWNFVSDADYDTIVNTKYYYFGF